MEPLRHARPSEAQVAIFDFDGTIVDSLEQAITAYNQLAPRFFVKPIDRHDVPRLRTLGARTAMREHGVSWWKLPFLVRSMRSALHEHVDGLQAFPGMADALRGLVARGHRLCILSTNSNRTIERFLARNDLHIFEQVAGGTSMFGKARALRTLLRDAKLDARSALYIGDEVRDLEAAHASGLRSVAVSWGYAGRESLAAARPTHLIDRPEELATYLP